MARLTLGHDLLLSVLLLSTLFTTVTWYERSLYLSTSTRTVIMWILVDMTLLLGLLIIIRGLGTWRGWWPWVRLETLAHRVGDRLNLLSDRLLNALQLEYRLNRQESPANADLLGRSVELVAQKLAVVDFRMLTPRRYKPPTRLAGIVMGLLILAWITAPRSMSQAATRLLHPEVEYPVPMPFILFSLSGDMHILGGDTTDVVFTAVGTVPRVIELVWKDNQNRQSSAQLTLANERYTYSFEGIHDDVRYYARFANPSWFSPWDQITSQVHSITIIDRPVIEDLTFTITAPEYTGQPVETIGGNVADITTLVGSRIDLAGATNLPLKSATLNLNGEEIPLEIEDRSIQGGFLLEQSAEMVISVTDRRNVTNANPIHYTFTALQDYSPSLSVILPLLNVDLDESMMVPVHFDVSDDFGFSQAQITYEVHHPEYLTQDDQTYTHAVPELQVDRRSQRVAHVWELSQLNLMPGDEVHFHIEVYDNNVMSGPGKAVSGTMIARLPTLTDLFTQFENSSEETVTITEDVLENLAEVKALLEEMDLAFRGEENVSWEQQQKGKQVLETLEEIIEAMESVQEQIQKLGEMAETNSLFSDEILQKYDELQNLLEEIMTPELEDAMSRLRDALEQVDPERLRNALQNMQFQTSEFEAQLDRYLDIFRRALAEMKMDEVVQRLEYLAATEEQLLNQLDQAARDQDNSDTDNSLRELRDLSARHEEQERALDAAQETMREAAEAVAPFSPETARNLTDLRTSDLAQNTDASLQQGTRALTSQQLAVSQARLQESSVLLHTLRDEAAAIQKQFQRSTVSDMLARFQRILSGILTTSKIQEDLLFVTQDLPRNSPRVGETAEAQHVVLKGLSRLIDQLIALSRQSFHITPEVGRAIGRANAAMNQAIDNLEANDPRNAANAQQESMKALNETAIALGNAMSEMQQSGSASGYEQFLERMQHLTQGQQGLNQQVLSMQLGQIAGMSRIELMRRLQARQRQLAEVLEQILEDYPTQSGGKQGGLGQALQDMEEVINDFQRRRVTRRTQERQQQIVTRLLDSQKSLTVRDFKEERRGEAPTQHPTYVGPSGLPDNLGEREDLLMQAMEKALRSGYSQDYQIVIQNYFQRLIGSTGEDE